MKKSKISAEIIADSKNEHGQRITSFVLTFPRIILAEVNTHRMFSRNSSSSRAIPFKKMVEKCKNDPFIPIAWQKDHSGMQGKEYMGELESSRAMSLWAESAGSAIKQAEMLSSIGVTKQLVNRVLEPFMWHTAIVTATEFENFFKQRCPQYISESGMIHRSRKDYVNQGDFPEDEGDLSDISIVDWLSMNEGGAEIHIMELAEQMWDAMSENTPKQLKAGEWHIPFGDQMDEDQIDVLAAEEDIDVSPRPVFEQIKQKIKTKIATARCARVSYMNFDGNDDYRKDIELHDRLIKMRHASPFEHIAQAMGERDMMHSVCANPITNTIPYLKDPSALGWSGNFQGFIQYRKTFEGESGRD